MGKIRRYRVYVMVPEMVIDTIGETKEEGIEMAKNSSFVVYSQKLKEAEKVIFIAENMDEEEES